jgi:hypothetical protein
MTKITLYTEPECPDCIDLKERLKKANIDFENKDLLEKSDNLMNQYPNKWEHKDLVDDYQLPPWVPMVILDKGEKHPLNFVCSSTKTGTKGNIHIAETTELMEKKIKELL